MDPDIMLKGIYKLMVYSHRLSPGPWQGTHFSGPETVSGVVFQLYFNGFQVSSPGPRYSQCEWFPHSIDPSACRGPGPGHSQCD